MKKTPGRPPKVNYKIIMRLEDALQHSTSVTDACSYAGISRDTYYRYIKNEPAFAEKMSAAKANQYKLVFSLLTRYQ